MVSVLSRRRRAARFNFVASLLGRCCRSCSLHFSRFKSAPMIRSPLAWALSRRIPPESCSPNLPSICSRILALNSAGPKHHPRESVSTPLRRLPLPGALPSAAQSAVVPLPCPPESRAPPATGPPEAIVAGVPGPPDTNRSCSKGIPAAAAPGSAAWPAPDSDERNRTPSANARRRSHPPPKPCNVH